MLGPLRSFLETLQGHAVVAQTDSRVFVEALNQPIHDAFVEVFAAEVGIAGRRKHFE